MKMHLYREWNLNLHFLMEHNLTKNFILTMWVQLKSPFINENVFELPKTSFHPRKSNLNLHFWLKRTDLTKNLISLPWIQCKMSTRIDEVLCLIIQQKNYFFSVPPTSTIYWFLTFIILYVGQCSVLQ